MYIYQGKLFIYPLLQNASAGKVNKYFCSKLHTKVIQYIQSLSYILEQLDRPKNNSAHSYILYFCTSVKHCDDMISVRYHHRQNGDSTVPSHS